MNVAPVGQRNPYKGSPPRPWILLRFAAADGTFRELELLADTGNPCALIIGQANMALLKQGTAPDMQCNFGLLEGGWVQVDTPGLSLGQPLLSYACDPVVTAAKASSPDFDGLAGLPLLRLMEYGGDADWFWIRSAAGASGQP
jgi:hypothetical protein